MKRYWYHVSPGFKGREVLFRPRHIERAGPDEPDMKRICVAPTIWECFGAIHPLETAYYIYRTKHKVQAEKPYGVDDAKITKEHWLLSPRLFKCIGKLTQDTVGQFPSRYRGYSDKCTEYYLQSDDIKSIRQIIKQNEILTLPVN